LHTHLVTGLDATLREQPLVAIAVLFGAGLATSLTPCVYPMIPITAGVLSGLGTGRAARSRALVLTLAYAAGVALVYSLLGLLAGMTGTLFGTVSSSPWAYFLTANLLLVFGLALLDVFTVSAPARWAAWAGRLVEDSPGAAFAMGGASGLVAAPCGAPAFAAVLTFVAGSGNPALGFLYLLTFSLGMTALLIAVGLFGGLLVALPRAGRWMLWVKRGGGVLLIGMAEYYLVRMGSVL
jgi:thiol:disulfide interchange protein DsbD